MKPDYANTPDEALFALYRAEGDERAFTALVERYRGPIVGFLSKRLSNPDHVEELWQDTLYRVARARASYDPAYRFSTWIHTITSNLLKNHYRNAARNREIDFSALAAPSHVAAAPFDPVDAADLPDRHAYRAELRAAVHTTLGHLAPQHRTPLVLREFEDRSYEEIADVLGIPLGTVKSRLNRARSAFRTLFERHVEPQPTL